MRHNVIVGNSYRGPVEQLMLINSISHYDEVFGVPHFTRNMHQYKREEQCGRSSDIVFHWFQNTGLPIYFYRMANCAERAFADFRNCFSIEATSPGEWGNDISIRIARQSAEAFSLSVRFVDKEHELFENIGMTPFHALDVRSMCARINAESRLIVMEAMAEWGWVKEVDLMLSNGSDGELVSKNSIDSAIKMLYGVDAVNQVFWS